MRTTHRVLALAFASVLALGACSSSSTTNTSGTTATPGGTTSATTKTTAGGTTVGSAPGTTKATPGSTPGTAKSGTSAVATTGALTITVITTPYGKALANGDGKVLYAWDKETGPDAVCVAEACVAKWPPATGSSVTVEDGVDATLFTLVDRPDGTQQVAVDGHRLYTMVADEPGDANCQGLEGWYIRKPDGSSNREGALDK